MLIRMKYTVSPAEERLLNRLDISDLDNVQKWAKELDVSVVDLLDATRIVGTWVPALRRHLHPPVGFGSTPR